MVLDRLSGALCDALQFSDEQTASYAPLALVAANAHLARGHRDLAEHWTAAAARAARAESAPATSVGAGVAMMRAAIARDGVAHMRDDAARPYELEV